MFVRCSVYVRWMSDRRSLDLRSMIAGLGVRWMFGRCSIDVRYAPIRFVTCRKGVRLAQQFRPCEIRKLVSSSCQPKKLGSGSALSELKKLVSGSCGPQKLDSGSGFAELDKLVSGSCKPKKLDSARLQLLLWLLRTQECLLF